MEESTEQAGQPSDELAPLPPTKEPRWKSISLGTWLGIGALAATVLLAIGGLIGYGFLRAVRSELLHRSGQVWNAVRASARHNQ